MEGSLCKRRILKVGKNDGQEKGEIEGHAARENGLMTTRFLHSREVRAIQKRASDRQTVLWDVDPSASNEYLIPLSAVFHL